MISEHRSLQQLGFIKPPGSFLSTTFAKTLSIKKVCLLYICPQYKVGKKCSEPNSMCLGSYCSFVPAVFEGNTSHCA